MTRDEYRKACIEAIKRAFLDHYDRSILNLDSACLDALDALHGVARVCPVEATEEMISASSISRTPSKGWRHASALRYYAMSTSGDLTNPPEQKP